MTIYQDVFGGANVYPSDVSYSALTCTQDTAVQWPLDAAASATVVTRIMDITSDDTGCSLVMPSATQVSPGETVLFNNIGSYTIEIFDFDTIQIVTVAPGEAWQIYLTDNSTDAGSWRTFQYGAGVSSANASALAGTGIVAVGTLLSQSIPITAFNSDYTADAADRAKMYNWTGSAGTLTLPQPASVGDNWFLYLRNSGSGAIVADAPGVITIDGSASLSFQPGESAIIASDGSNLYTIGFGQSATFTFDYTVIAVAGTGNYTLTGSELNRISYRFTGALTGDRDIIVPATVQQYWVDNQTTGAYVFEVRTPAGLGVTLGSGERAILYSDGTNILRADTAGVSYPIAVSQGGTGATAAGAALINLGGTAVGTALFAAVDQAAAWSTLGIAPDGVVNGGTF